MKKNLLILFTGLAIVVISAQIYINSFIKKEVLNNVSQLISSEISLSSVSLSRFSSLVLRNIQIKDPTDNSQNIFKIKRARISFKPMQFIQTKDIMKSITSIKITKGESIIHHYKDDSFNISSLINKSDTATATANTSEPLANIDIKFKKCSLRYVDERGFGPKPFDEAKTHTFFDLNSTIEIGSDKTKIKANGLLNKDENEVEIEGYIKKDTYEVNIHTDKSEIAYIINYFVNMPDLVFKNAVGEVDVSLKPNKLIKKTDIPIAIDVSMNIHEGMLDTTWLPPILLVKKGKVYVTNKGVFIKDVHGEASSEKFEVNGDILDFYKLNLNITARDLQYRNAHSFLPFLKAWKLNGSGLFTFKLFTNPADEIVMSGKVHGYTGNIFQYKVSDTDLSFSMKHNIVNLQLPRINAYKGKGKGDGIIRLRAGKSPSINMHLSLEKVSINDYFQSPHFKDTGDLRLLLYNTADDLKGTVLFNSTTASVFGQKIKSMTMFWNKKADRLLFLKNSYASLNTDQSKVFFDGYLADTQFFDINILNKIYPFETDNFYFFSSKVGTYHGESDLRGNFKGYFNDAFKENPLKTTNGKCTLYNTRFNTDFLKQDVLTGNGTVVVDKYIYIDVRLKNTQSSINIFAKTDNKGLIYSTFDLNNLAMVHSKSFVKTSFFDYFGFASGKLRLFPNNNKLFINKYGVTGNFTISDTTIITSNYATQNINHLSGEIKLKNNALVLSNAQLIQTITNAKFNCTYRSTQDFSIDFLDSRLQSSEIAYTPKNINLAFKVLNGQIFRTNKIIKLDLDIDTNLVSYKSIELPNFKGDVHLDKSILSFGDLEIYNKEDVYKISGNISTNIGKKKTIANKTKYSLDIHFIKGRLENLAGLYQRLSPYWAKDNKTITSTTDKDTKKRIGLLSNYNKLIQKNYVNLYSLKENSVAKLLDSIKIKEQQEILNELPSTEGSITGYLQLSNTDNFQFFSDLSIRSGRIIYGYFDYLQILAQQDKQEININVDCHNLTFLENLFEEISSSGQYSPNTQILKVRNINTTFEGNESNNILRGNVNLSSLFDKEQESKSGDLNLHLELLKNDINVLSILNGSARKISNDGDVIIDITGSLQQPLFNARSFELKEFQLDFVPNFPIRSPIRINDAIFTLKNNVLAIPQTALVWQGKDTNFKENKFIINGTVFINPFFNHFDSLPIMFNLTSKPTTLDLNLDNLYVGKAKTDQIYLNGTLQIPFSKKAKAEYEQNILNEKEKGPTIKTNIEFNDGKILILGNKKPAKHKPSILFNTSINLGKEIYVTGRDFSTDVNNILNNIHIELEEEPSDIPVKGSLNTIDLEHSFNLRSGKIVFMNKVFQLMEKSKQRDVFNLSPENIQDNIVEMRMMPDPKYPTKRKTKPYFDIKAYSIINKSVAVSQNVEVTTNVTYTIEEHLFIIFIEGFLNTPQSLSIEHYLVANNSYTLAEPRIYLDQLSAEQLDTISDYLLPVLLKPEFYQSLISKGLQNNDEANELLRNYSASQINLWIDQQLRPFEKDVANTMGLYDVNIEHNFGGEIVNTVPVFKEEQSTLSDEKVQIEYVKDLFLKKLFVKLKTGISQDPGSNSYAVKLTEYELAWLLNDYISVNYGNHNLQDNIYGAFSINANFNF